MYSSRSAKLAQWPGEEEEEEEEEMAVDAEALLVGAEERRSGAPCLCVKICGKCNAMQCNGRKKEKKERKTERQKARKNKFVVMQSNDKKKEGRKKKDRKKEQVCGNANK